MVVEHVTVEDTKPADLQNDLDEEVIDIGQPSAADAEVANWTRSVARLITKNN